MQMVNVECISDFTAQPELNLTFTYNGLPQKVSSSWKKEFAVGAESKLNNSDPGPRFWKLGSGSRSYLNLKNSQN